MRTYTVETLKRLGIVNIKECEDGSSALSFLSQFKPDVILTDVHMKPMNGLEFVKALRRLHGAAAARTHVIFMSADSSQETLGSALPLGIKGYIVKPPRLTDLKAKIEAALR